MSLGAAGPAGLGGGADLPLWQSRAAGRVVVEKLKIVELWSISPVAQISLVVTMQATWV